MRTLLTRQEGELLNAALINASPQYLFDMRIVAAKLGWTYEAATEVGSMLISADGVLLRREFGVVPDIYHIPAEGRAALRQFNKDDAAVRSERRRQRFEKWVVSVCAGLIVATYATFLSYCQNQKIANVDSLDRAATSRNSLAAPEGKVGYIEKSQGMPQIER